MYTVFTVACSRHRLCMTIGRQYISQNLFVCLFDVDVIGTLWRAAFLDKLGRDYVTQKQTWWQFNASMCSTRKSEWNDDSHLKHDVMDFGFFECHADAVWYFYIQHKFGGLLSRSDVWWVNSFVLFSCTICSFWVGGTCCSHCQMGTAGRIWTDLFSVFWALGFGSELQRPVRPFTVLSDWAAGEGRNCFPVPGWVWLPFCLCQTGPPQRRLTGKIRLQCSSALHFSCCLPKIRIITAALPFTISLLM